MKKWIIGLLAVLTTLSFVACGNSDDKPDCCKETENKQKDCCESTASAPEYDSNIPDCCGE